MNPIHAVEWSADGAGVRIIDQRLLPGRCESLELRTVVEVCEAIRTLAVRGAPAIGVAAAMGLVASLAPVARRSRAEFDAACADHAARISATRPTAVNLAWAVDRVARRGKAERGAAAEALAAMRSEATSILDEDRAMCEAIGDHGLEFVPDGTRVLTHCNAGALATAGIGTALAPVYAAHRAGRRVSVSADETRPLLQGSRLTAWELSRLGIPVRVIADGMAAASMKSGQVDLVLVGADRIARNGDVANKIGTYGLAIAARFHAIPFVVCAPSSTIDAATATGAEIEIEERNPGEIVEFGGIAVAPAGVDAWNPAFDVTPAELVTAIVTDRGVLRPPYQFAA